MLKSESGSTKRLLELCVGYFLFYTLTGVLVKYFLSSKPGLPHLPGMEYLVYSTTGGALIATGVVLVLKWYKLDSVKRITYAGITFPSEILYIIPSGVMTAIVIPTTTLMYSFKHISVMVAMVIMRGSVIVVSRIVDSLQIRSGILKKKVYLEENVAMVFALIAVGIKIFSGGGGKENPFTSLPVMIIFSAYISAYAVRIYIMNFYKNTRPKEKKKDNNKSFFAIEQMSSTTTLILVAVSIIIFAKLSGAEGERITPFVNAFFSPNLTWGAYAVLSGMVFGVVAFFSVFIFMFKGRTATFAGLVNRLTSLVAGTTATLLFAFLFGGRYPVLIDWISLALIFVAVGFISAAEKRRAKEAITQ